jgi:hypothetical protein
MIKPASMPAPVGGALLVTGEASFAQAHRHAMETAQPDHPQRVLRTVCRIRGPLDPDRLEAAIRAVVARHDALRMSFAPGSAGLRYEVQEQTAWSLRREAPIADAGPSDLPVALLRELNAELTARFDRSRAPLLTARLWPLGDQDWTLSIKVDHMVADAHSVSVLAADVAAAYNDGGFAAPAPSFARWIDAQARYFASDDATADREFWLRTLGGRAGGWNTLLPDFDLTVSAPPGEAARALPAELSAAADQFPRANRMTPYMMYLAALVLCLVRRTGDPDVCVLGPTANRSRELAGLVGWCAHGLAYRVDASPARTPADLAREVRASCLQVMAHQRYPLLRHRLDMDQAQQGQRLSLPYVALHPTTDYFSHVSSAQFAGLDTELVRGTAVEADPCLGLLARRRPDGVTSLGVHYGGFGYDEDRAGRLLADLEEALDLLVRQPDTELRQVAGWPA